MTARLAFEKIVCVKKEAVKAIRKRVRVCLRFFIKKSKKLH